MEPTPHVSSESANGTDTGIVDRVRERAGAELATQKDMATDGIGTIARAVRRHDGELPEQQHDTIADYVDRAADQLERLSRGLRTRISASCSATLKVWRAASRRCLSVQRSRSGCLGQDS